MQRGVVVRNKEGNYFIFLSMDEDMARCAVVEDVFDEHEQYFCARVTSLIKIPITELVIAETYPNYFNQINIA